MPNLRTNFGLNYCYTEFRQVHYWRGESSSSIAGSAARIGPAIKLRAQTRSPAISGDPCRNSFGILSLFKILWALLEWLKFCARLRTRERGCCFYWFYEKGLGTHMVVLGVLVRFFFCLGFFLCANCNTSRFMLHRGPDQGRGRCSAAAEVHHAYYISFRWCFELGKNPLPTMHLFAHFIVLERRTGFFHFFSFDAIWFHTSGEFVWKDRSFFASKNVCLFYEVLFENNLHFFNVPPAATVKALSSYVIYLDWMHSIWHRAQFQAQ